MGFIWDYKAKLRLHGVISAKVWEKKVCDDPNAIVNEINKYFDQLGFIRIVRTRASGWELEDSKETSKSSWKSVNKPGFVHISNPIRPGTFHKSNYLLRIPKEIAEKIMVIGLP